MNLANLTDVNLLARFEKLVRTERKITHLVLECILEIDHRKLYLDQAYPNLFEYLTQAHGYSAGSAQRRISAARLLGEIPEVALKIEEGRINLSQIALAAQTIKAAEKRFAVKMEGEAKLELLEKLESKNFSETQRILSQELKVEIPASDRTQHHGDDSVTITMTLSREQYADWLRVAELTSHITSGGKASELAAYLAKKEIARRTKIRGETLTKLKTEPAANPASNSQNTSPSCGMLLPRSPNRENLWVTSLYTDRSHSPRQ